MIFKLSSNSNHDSVKLRIALHTGTSNFIISALVCARRSCAQVCSAPKERQMQLQAGLGDPKDETRVGGLSHGQPQPENTKQWHTKPLVCSKLFILLLKDCMIYLSEWKQPENLTL